MFYYIYKTTSASGKYYIGRHSTNNLKDGYIGSGKWIKDCKKTNVLLTKVIIQFCKKEEIFNIEENMITKYFDDPLCMNFICSSKGLPLGYKHSEETKLKIGKGCKNPWNKGKNLPKYVIEKLNGRKPTIGMTGKKHSKESLKKMSEALKGRTPWNKGKTGVYSEATINKMKENHWSKHREKLNA